MELELKKCEPNELNKVAALAFDIWHKHYVPIIGLSQVNYMLDKYYSLTALESQLKQNNVFYFVEVDKNKVGFISVSQTVNNQQEEVFIHKFYIRQSQQNLGLGTKVLQALYGMFPTQANYRLTVNRQNYKSINFYFKNGFVIDSVADFDIGNNFVMNDFVMLKRANTLGSKGI